MSKNSDPLFWQQAQQHLVRYGAPFDRLIIVLDTMPTVVPF
jgi:hypothetical protein